MKRFFTLSLLLYAIYGMAQSPGEIVFSSSPVDPLNPANLKQSFTTGEHIYAVAYLPQTVGDYYSHVAPEKKVNLELFLYSVKPPLYSYQTQDREEQLTYANIILSGTLKNNKYLVVDLVPDPATTKVYASPEFTYKVFGKKWDGPASFAEVLASLEDSENVIKVVLKLYYNDAATGKFTLSGGNYGVYAGMAKQLNDGAADAGARSAVFPKAEKSDQALESRMITALKNSNDWKNGRLDATEVLRIAIYDKDWYIRRHEISGAILHRYIRAAVAVKGKTGQCGYYIVTYQEDYAGGKFQPLKYDGAGDRHAISCENIGK